MKAIGTVFVIILTSLFFFPFNSSLMPEVNTKLAMAVVGLFFLGYGGFKEKYDQLDSSLSTVTLWALAVSLAALVAVVVNETADYTYTTYVVSAWVWLSAAYVVIKSMKWVYGNVDLRLVTNILIAVCVIQCIISQLTDNYEEIAAWVKSFVVSTGFMGIPKNRLYGIGCALDVAGLKFCTVLILLSYFAVHPSGKINRIFESSLYIISFIIIGVFGSMISRTTTIGIGFAMLFWILYPLICRTSENDDYHSFFKTFSIFLVVLLPATIYLYHTDSGFQANLRFGFEGFFSLAEKGEWEVSSNEMLMGMWVWPDNLKSWLVGDGYFGSTRTNPYYVGPDFSDFYMGTDIGYCRFIFYFGLLGLVLFCLYFICCARYSSDLLPHCRIVFWLILAINFIGWVKVSSDIFPIFALLLMLRKETINEWSERPCLKTS